MSLFGRVDTGIEEHRLEMAIVGCISVGTTSALEIARDLAVDPVAVSASLAGLVSKGVVESRVEHSPDGQWRRWMLAGS